MLSFWTLLLLNVIIVADFLVHGNLLMQIGGPAYKIGMGGGAASSMVRAEFASHTPGSKAKA